MIFLVIIILTVVYQFPSGFSFSQLSLNEIVNTQEDNIEIIDDEDKININTAVIAELICLEQIGETRAQAIIDYRNSNGNFKQIEDIMNVSGISQSIFDKIENDIIV